MMCIAGHTLHSPRATPGSEIWRRPSIRPCPPQAPDDAATGTERHPLVHRRPGNPGPLTAGHQADRPPLAAATCCGSRRRILTTRRAAGRSGARGHRFFAPRRHRGAAAALIRYGSAALGRLRALRLLPAGTAGTPGNGWPAIPEASSRFYISGRASGELLFASEKLRALLTTGGAAAFSITRGA